MKGYIVDLEKEALANTDFRRVLYTAKHSQLVLMSIPSGKDIGEETHHLDQFLRFEGGSGTVILNRTDEHAVQDGYGVVIPAGVKHNVVNTGGEDLKLYSIYSPPEHNDGTVHPTKEEAVEEHFDGTTTE